MVKENNMDYKFEIMDMDKLMSMSQSIFSDAEFSAKSCRKPQNIRKEELVANTWGSILHYLQELKQLKEERKEA